MAEEYPKYRGVVIRFNNKKGYGFIKPDDGGNDLFVHHSDINSDGFRTLQRNQSVEFLILVDEQENKTKAGDVSIVHNSPIKNGKVIECYNCGKYGHMAKDCYNTNGCYNCGLFGHFARDYANASYCFNCEGEYGHITRDCTNTNTRSRGGACYNCGGVGHFARDCTSARYNGDTSSNGGGGNGGGRRDGGKCYNCDKEGRHFARDCPNGKK